MNQMLTGSLNAIWDACHERHARWRGAARQRISGLTIGTEPRASAEDARWLAERIRRDHTLRADEVALINFLKSKQAFLHPQLLPVLDCVAA